MARMIPPDMLARDLTDAHGASRIAGCSRSRIHQYATEGRLKVYIFLDGDLVEAEESERQGQIALFNRYQVAQLPRHSPRQGGRPRKNSSLATS